MLEYHIQILSSFHFYYCCSFFTLVLVRFSFLFLFNLTEMRLSSYGTNLHVHHPMLLFFFHICCCCCNSVNMQTTDRNKSIVMHTEMERKHHRKFYLSFFRDVVCDKWHIWLVRCHACMFHQESWWLYVEVVAYVYDIKHPLSVCYTFKQNSVVPRHVPVLGVPVCMSVTFSKWLWQSII